MKANQETILIEMMHADEDSGLYDSVALCVFWILMYCILKMFVVCLLQAI